MSDTTDRDEWIDDERPSRLRQARDRDGVTQEQLADLLGVSSSTVRRAERGARNSAGETAVALYRYTIGRVQAVQDEHGRWSLVRRDDSDRAVELERKLSDVANWLGFMERAIRDPEVDFGTWDPSSPFRATAAQNEQSAPAIVDTLAGRIYDRSSRGTTGEAASAHLMLRLTPTHKERLAVEAKRLGITVSTLLRLGAELLINEGQQKSTAGSIEEE